MKTKRLTICCCIALCLVISGCNSQGRDKNVELPNELSEQISFPYIYINYNIATDNAAESQEIIEYNIVSGEERVVSSDSLPWSIAFNSEYTKIVGINSNCDIIEVDIETGDSTLIISGEKIDSLLAGPFYFNSIQYVPACDDISLLTEDGRIIRYDRDSDELEVLLFAGKIYSFSWLGDSIIYPDENGLIKYDSKNKTQSILTEPNDYKGLSTIFDIAPDGSKVAYVGKSGNLRIISLDKDASIPDVMYEIENDLRGPVAFTLSPDGNAIFYAVPTRESSLFNPPYYELYVAVGEKSALIGGCRGKGGGADICPCWYGNNKENS